MSDISKNGLRLLRTPPPAAREAETVWLHTEEACVKNCHYQEVYYDLLVRDGPARLTGNFKKYNQTIILRILPILAKLGQKTIKNEQKQSILTQGGQKTIKIDQKTIVVDQNNNPRGAAAPRGRRRRRRRCCFDQN